MNTRANYTDITPTIHWKQRALAWHLCLCFWLLIVVSVLKQISLFLVLILTKQRRCLRVSLLSPRGLL